MKGKIGELVSETTPKLLSDRKEKKSYYFGTGGPVYCAPTGDLFIGTHGLAWGPLDTGDLPAERKIAICKQFLSHCEQTKTPRIDSGHLKHVIEQWAGEYIPQGACIEAVRQSYIFFVVPPLIKNRRRENGIWVELPEPKYNSVYVAISTKMLAHRWSYRVRKEFPEFQGREMLPGADTAWIVKEEKMRNEAKIA